MACMKNKNIDRCKNNYSLNTVSCIAVLSAMFWFDTEQAMSCRHVIFAEYVEVFSLFFAEYVEEIGLFNPAIIIGNAFAFKRVKNYSTNYFLVAPCNICCILI